MIHDLLAGVEDLGGIFLILLGDHVGFEFSHEAHLRFQGEAEDDVDDAGTGLVEDVVFVEEREEAHKHALEKTFEILAFLV